jgi:hypothetical protein
MVSLFLIFFCGAPLSAEAEDFVSLQSLSQSIEWRMLLHAPKSKSFIKDPSFFLSHPFDKYGELIATIQAFKSHDTLNDQHALCRFPARYLFLKEKLHWKDEDFPNPKCTLYEEFLDLAPAEKIQLVFASENVVSPISMMGHVFLKLSGTTKNNFYAEHAVTYFTVLDSLNIPRIAYQNFTEDLPGVFALQPYQRIRQKYLQKEKRNIWEYNIPLTQAKKTLLQAHIWELKGMNSDYLFAGYNCATVTYFLLALIEPKILEANLSWVTPIDVVKIVNKYQLVSSVRVVTSDHWKIQMLLDYSDEISITPKELENVSPKHVNYFVSQLTKTEKLLGLAYIGYVQNAKPELYEEHKTGLLPLMKELRKETRNYMLDYSAYKNPAKAPGNSQVQISVGQFEQKNFLDISLLPAANRLTDDQRQFFSAHELKIADLSLRFFTDKKPKLNYFDILNMKSLNPWNIWTRSLSGQWRVGWENHLDSKLNTHLVFNVAAGLGYSIKLGEDTMVSLLYNLGAASNAKVSYLYHYPEVIMQMNEILNMKTTVYAKSYFNLFASSTRNDALKICQSYYPEQNRTLLACFKQQQNPMQKHQIFSLAFQQHF